MAQSRSNEGVRVGVIWTFLLLDIWQPPPPRCGSCSTLQWSAADCMQVCCSLTSTTSPYCSSLNAYSALQYHKYEYVITATNQVVKKRGCQLPCTFLTRWLTLLLCSAVAPSVMFRCLSLWNVAISELMIGLLITGCWIGIHYTTPPAYKLPFRNLCLGIWCFIIKSFFDLRCADKELKANIPGRVC